MKVKSGTINTETTFTDSKEAKTEFENVKFSGKDDYFITVGDVKLKNCKIDDIRHIVNKSELSL